MRKLIRFTTRSAAAIAMTLLGTGCSSLVFTVANLPARFSSVQLKPDIPYGPESRQKLDIYMPAASTAARPVVIFWYGGAWTEGRKSDYRFVGAALAKQGYVVVLPDYRLYPQVKFPSFVEDGARAVAWVQAQVQAYGGDPKRIILMGHSAGAHLAALLAYDAHYLDAAGADRTSIRGFVGLSGPYALAPDDAVLNSIFAPPYTSHDWQAVQQVDARAPPTLLLHGIADRRVYVTHTQQLHDALVAQGAHVEMELYAGASHADTVQGFSAFRRRRAPTLERVLRFLQQRVPIDQQAAGLPSPQQTAPDPAAPIRSNVTQGAVLAGNRRRM